MLAAPLMAFTIEEHGFEIVEGVLAAKESHDLIRSLGPVSGAGRRGLLRVPEVAALSRSEVVLRMVRAHLDREPVAVRAIYFDKNPQANWGVTWHQDLLLALRHRVA